MDSTDTMECLIPDLGPDLKVSSLQINNLTNKLANKPYQNIASLAEVMTKAVRVFVAKDLQPYVAVIDSRLCHLMERNDITL